MWKFNIAVEHDPFLDDLLINNTVIFHGYVKFPEGMRCTSL